MTCNVEYNTKVDIRRATSHLDYLNVSLYLRKLCSDIGLVAYGGNRDYILAGTYPETVLYFKNLHDALVFKLKCQL